MRSFLGASRSRVSGLYLITLYGDKRATTGDGTTAPIVTPPPSATVAVVVVAIALLPEKTPCNSSLSARLTAEDLTWSDAGSGRPA